MIIDDYLAYLADVRRLSAATVRLRSTYLAQLHSDCFDLLVITTAQLRVWIAARPEWAPQTVNAATSTFRSFYRWAHEVGRIPTDPAAPLRTVAVPTRKPRIATLEQIGAGLAAKLEVRALTMLGVECGLRVHEIAKLAKTDRDDDWLTIVGKGGQQRSVHISPELAAVLDALDAKAPGSPWYFPSRSRTGHVTTETLRVWTRRILGTNPHSLRHRAGTTVYRGTGNNLRLTQVFLGHRYPATTAIYVHVERDDLLRAGEAARLAA